jgi:hypothetical protein
VRALIRRAHYRSNRDPSFWPSEFNVCSADRAPAVSCFATKRAITIGLLW